MFSELESVFVFRQTEKRVHLIWRYDAMFLSNDKGESEKDSQKVVVSDGLSEEERKHELWKVWSDGSEQSQEKSVALLLFVKNSRTVRQNWQRQQRMYLIANILDITLKDFSEHMKGGLSINEIENTFNQANEYKDGKLRLNEFAKIIIPSDYVIREMDQLYR